MPDEHGFSGVKWFAMHVYVLSFCGFKVLNVLAPQLTAVERDKMADGMALQRDRIEELASHSLWTLVDQTLGNNPQKWFTDTLVTVNDLCVEIRIAVASWRQEQPSPNDHRITALCLELRNRAIQLDRGLTVLGFDRFGNPLKNLAASVDPQPATAGTLENPPMGKSSNTEPSVAEVVNSLAMLLGDGGPKLIDIIHDTKLTVDLKLRALDRLDVRFQGYTSPVLADLLSVSEAAIRNSDCWKEWQPKRGDE